MIYVYDGTWDGLMCLIYKTAKDGAVPEEILRLARQGGKMEQGFLFESTVVDNDPAVAEATDSVLRKRVSGRMLSDVWFAFLSGDRGVDIALWNALAQIWFWGERGEADLAEPCIHTVRKAALHTGREYHRHLGMVRFKDVGGIFYAQVEPECDVLTLLAEHFSDRLSGSGWVLHDLSRDKAAVYDGNKWVVTDMELAQVPQITVEERRYQELWREFYRSTTTRERLSYKRQRGHMPKKYWKHLIEIPGELHGNL